MKGKQTRRPFPKNAATRAKELSQIVHTDVCGPTNTQNLGGNHYFMKLIDDKSRSSAIYFMKRKDEVFQKFKEFEAMAANITGNSIKELVSDNGGEYMSKGFRDFLTQKGNMRQLTILRTPEHNGVTKRMNRTI